MLWQLQIDNAVELNLITLIIQSLGHTLGVAVYYTGCFVMFCMIINIYDKKTKGPTLMELFTTTGKLEKFFLQLEMFDVCTTCDTAYIDMCAPRVTWHTSIQYSSCCHTRVNMLTRVWHPWCTHRKSLVVKKKNSVFLWLWTIPLRYVLWFLVINVCNHGEHYETPCIIWMLLQ